MKLLIGPVDDGLRGTTIGPVDDTCSSVQEEQPFCQDMTFGPVDDV